MSAERPRDRLGRPLPRGAEPDPGVPPVPDVVDLSDDAVLSMALSFVDDGLPFHAHEVCEQRWRTCDPADRDRWRALAQWGAAETHAARGNDEGARRLAQRALPIVSAAVGCEEIRERCHRLL